MPCGIRAKALNDVPIQKRNLGEAALTGLGRSQMMSVAGGDPADLALTCWLLLTQTDRSKIVSRFSTAVGNGACLELRAQYNLIRSAYSSQLEGPTPSAIASVYLLVPHSQVLPKPTRHRVENLPND